MDERVRTFAWVLAGTGFFGLLGAAFGALAGHLSWRGGRRAGTAAGLTVARAFARAAGREFSPGRTGALVGGCDGLLFLGVLGAALGLVAAARGRAGWGVLGSVAFGALALVGGAVFFGTLAYGIRRGGVRALAGVFAGGMLGAFAGSAVAGADGLVFGAVAGVVAGTLLGVATHGAR
jgi:hypothetical protein